MRRRQFFIFSGIWELIRFYIIFMLIRRSIGADSSILPMILLLSAPSLLIFFDQFYLAFSKQDDFFINNILTGKAIQVVLSSIIIFFPAFIGTSVSLFITIYMIDTILLIFFYFYTKKEKKAEESLKEEEK